MVSTVPSAIADLLDTRVLNGRTLLSTLETDLDENGLPAEQWLILTEQEVGLVTAADSSEPDRLVCRTKFILGDLEGCRVTTEVGSGYLQVKHQGVWVDLVRFSNRLVDDFRSLAHKLERLRRYREFLIDEPSLEIPRCPQCGADLDAVDEPCKQCRSAGRSIRRVLRLLRPHAGSVAIVTVLSFVTVALELVPPWLQKELVDRVLTNGSESPDRAALLTILLTIVGILAGVRLAAAILAVIKARLATGVGATLTAELRSRMVQKLQRLSLSYHDRNQVGLLMSRVTYDTEAMHTFMHQLTGGFVLQMVQMAAIGGMMFWLNPKLALIALMPSPAVGLVTWVFCRYFYSQQNRYWDAVGRQATALTNLLSGIRVVKSFTQEDRESQRFTATSEQLRDNRIQVDFITATFSSTIGFLFAVGGLLVWYVGGRNVLGQEMSLGSLMAFLSYLAMFYAPLATVSEGASWISSFVAASQRIFDLLDSPASTEEPAQSGQLPVLRGNIEFDQVCFSYDGRQSVLEDISFQVAAGQMVGIVGRSGSGKSTMAGLISRLYDIESGAIRIDGRDVREFGYGELRRQVGIVLQEPFLFEGTVAANIAYGDPAAPKERIIASAKAAAAHDFILRLPFGYETPLGERGAGLSGGERQRVSIARAILYDPRILILDEATSSIDTESERLIQQAIERFSQGRTVLAIAHRLSTLERADFLLVIDRGRLVEKGTHAELLAADGVYARLVRLQFGDKLTEAQQNGAPHAGDDRIETSIDDSDWQIRWLRPDLVHWDSGPHGTLALQLDGLRYEGISILRTFPATHGEEYLSIRHVTPTGQVRELGLLERLEEWPQREQELIRRALNRRYLLRVVQQIDSFYEEHSSVRFEAQTDAGEAHFTVQNKMQDIKPFGDNGRLLTDVNGNHFLVPNVNELTAVQQLLLKSPIQAL